MQWLVLLLTLVGIGLVAYAFYFVIRRSGERIDDYTIVVGSAYSLRKKWFAFLLIAGVVVSIASLTPFPIADASAKDEQVVNAVGGQWYWKLDTKELMVNQPVVFKVTAADVNHGFAIYNSEDQLLTQVQAMPHYTNELRYTFTKTGKYRVLCLEYCGVAHHAMKAEFTVKGAE